MECEKTKLLFVVTELYKGGAEVALVNLLKKLNQVDYSIDLLILSQKKFDNSLVEQVPRWVQVCNAGILNLKAGFEGTEDEFLYGGNIAQDFVKNKSYDIAFSYGEWCRLDFVAKYVIAKEKNVWIHTDIAVAPNFNEDRFFSTFSDYRFYIFVSETTRINAVEKYPFIQKKTIVIHNILDKEELENMASAPISEFKNVWTHKIITVANVRYEKGYQRIFEVAKELKQRNFEFEWFCVGAFSDSGLANEISNGIKSNGLEKHLYLLGAKENPYPYIAHSDLFVLLSDYEAWPMAMAESMLLGVPALATSTSGAKEHIKDQKNGLLTSFDINEIADKIQFFFEEKDLQNQIKKEVCSFGKDINGFLEFDGFMEERMPRRKTMERLDFGQQVPYNSIEASIHLNRYAMTRPFCKDKRVLDVACGEGYGSFLMKQWGALQVDAIDIDESTVKKAQHLFGSDNVRFHCHTAEELPFESYTFDLITSFETIEHLDNPEKFLKEIKRVLRPGGTILLSCPNDPYYYKADDEGNPFHKQRYTYFEFKELAERCLGNHVKYYLGFAVDGFLNMPLEKSTVPDENGLPITNSMFELFNYTECSSALFLESDRLINQWNSNYYVGIWGAIPPNFEISAAVFPREFFVEHKDEDISLRKEMTNWTSEKNSMKALLEEKEVEIKKIREDVAIEMESLREYQNHNSNKAYKDLKHECDTAHLETDRLSLMLELITKEKDCLSRSASSNYNQFMQINSLYELAKEDINKNTVLYKQVKTELDIMKSTKGYKILNLIYRFRCKMRAIFHLH